MLADVLYEETDPVGALQLLGSMGLKPSEIAAGIGVPPDIVESWHGGNIDDVPEHELAIYGLKSTTIYLLKRGILNPSELALWLTQPLENLQGDTPLITLPQEGGLEAVLLAAAPFIR